MTSNHPIVSFDTSAHNRLLDDGSLSEPMFAGLQSGLFFRFAGLSIEELVSCPDSTRRTALFACCGRLQFGSSDCIYPHNELLRLQIAAHFRDSDNFNWKVVDVRAREYEKAIQQRALILDEQLSAAQRCEQFARAKEYDHMFAGLRPILEGLFKSHGEAPPLTFQQALSRAENAKPNLVLGIGKLLYDRAVGTDATDATINAFIATCPPFRALIFALLMSWYDRALRDRHTGEKYRSGRNDLFMAAHLPYCNRFITAEKSREQEKCLREIAILIGLETEILSYDEFSDSFLAAV